MRFIGDAADAAFLNYWISVVGRDVYKQLAAVSLRFIGDAMDAVFWGWISVVGREKTCINNWRLSVCAL